MNVNTTVGEARSSYAYCRTGRKANANIFSDYGHSAQPGDVITVVLVGSFNQSKLTVLQNVIANDLRIYINDEDLGVAFTDLNFTSNQDTDYSVIFPHISLKNVKAFVNFGMEQPETGDAKPWPVPSALHDKEFKFFGQFERRPTSMTPTSRPPPSKSDCTVIMMVGLPAAGKSNWVRNYLSEHPTEHWITINSEIMLDYMKVCFKC
jgi:heterogeneous nuclear ribonucleoprotein U-like protein 1